MKGKAYSALPILGVVVAMFGMAYGQEQNVVVPPVYGVDVVRYR